MEDRIFYKVIQKKAPAYIIDENENIIVFLSHENHPSVVTKRLIPDIYTLDDKSAAAVMVEVVKIAKAVKEGSSCDGVNLVQANEPEVHQDVYYFHLHIKPRWNNDTVLINWETEKRIKKHYSNQKKNQSRPSFQAFLLCTFTQNLGWHRLNSNNIHCIV